MIDYKKELKNIGITPIEELSVQERTNIAEKVAEKLMSLNVPGLFYHSILEKLFESKMCTAKISNNLGQVSYFYKNKTIYFNKGLNIENIDENIMRECIHCLQDTRKHHEKLKRIGLCTFEEFKVKGMALNEIGVNYISNKLFNKLDKNKSYALLNQMLLITGEDVFFDSLLNNNNKFEEKFMEETNSEVLYYKMQNCLDAMFDLEQIIKRLNSDGRKSKNPEKYLSKINMHKHTLTSKFLEIQYQIYNRYFSRKAELIDEIEDIKKYKEELFNYSQWLDLSEDELKYTNFINEKIEKLNKIEIEVLRKNSNNSLIVVQEGIIHKIFRAIKKILFKPKEYEINKNGVQ